MKALRGVMIGFVGAGTMGQALVNGLLAQGMPRRAIWVSDPSAVARRRARRLGVRVLHDNPAVVQAATVLVLAVKPQEMPSVLTEIAPRVRRTQLVVSIAAGITLRYLSAQLPGVPLVRVMPNLAATRQRGFAAFALGRHAGAAHRAMAKAIFESVGTAVELPERLFNAVTAVSGSGPAYVFFLAQVWEEGALAVGLPRKIARQAVRETLLGSAQLLTNGRLTPQQWIARVASKRGTTEAALRVLGRRRIARHFTEALRAATRRSEELSRS
jgi:pyrroline-5-carboxylate reductase